MSATKIVVCVEATGLGEASRAALVLGLGLEPRAEVIVLSAVPSFTQQQVLDEALAMGADRAIQVLDPSADRSDPQNLGQTVAEAVRRLEASVVLAGTRSGGEGRGVVPAAIAHHLRALYLAHVESLEAPAASPELVVTLRAGGRRRRLAVTPPAVLTVAPAAVDGARTTGTRRTVRTGATVESLRLHERTERTALTRMSTSSLGSLERPRRKPANAASADELVKRWLNSGR